MLNLSAEQKNPKKKQSFLGNNTTKSQQDILHGTGLTSRASERAEKALDRHEKEIGSVITDEEVKTSIIETDHPDILTLGAPKDIVWDDSQIAALKGLSKQQFGCLIGAAGTGKTTVTKELVRQAMINVPLISMNSTRPKHLHNDEDKSTNVAVGFCAFTGRATEQLKKALPAEYHELCHTIHATLGYMPFDEEYFDEKSDSWKTKKVFHPTFNAANKLPFKLIVVDESGMFAINLANELFDAITDDCRIILIGDINQLPPVQGRSVLGFAMINWPTFTLEKIHRQAADNPIISNAHRILQGLMPRKAEGKFEIKALPPGGESTHKYVVDVVKQFVKNGEFDPINDAFIVPQNVGIVGQVHFNEYFVQAFNPAEIDPVTQRQINPRELIRAGRNNPIFAIGDKVMLLQNDRERNLTNGMTGVITDIKVNGSYRGEHHKQMNEFDIDGSDMSFDLDGFDDALDTEEAISVKQEEEEDENKRQASHVVTVKFKTGNFETEVPFSTSGQFGKLTHAYAFTCHKSQGGEYPTVIIVCHSTNAGMLNREWLYTAITRAQNKVILLANDRGLLKAVNNQTIKGNTIEEKANCFLALQDKHDTKLPNLPKPREI